nr:MAG TPA: hypothetical protein [Caudoviricetes sp.]
MLWLYHFKGLSLFYKIGFSDFTLDLTIPYYEM